MCARRNYAAALDFLLGRADFERWPGYNYAGRFDLRRMDYLLERLGNPHLAAKSVHVAGSKGKGSTAAMIAAGLQADGCRTGLYTSPHLITLRERIAVDGRPVLKSELADIAVGLRPFVEACDRDCPYGELTTFELLTAAAFVHFKQKHVDFQVLETGLGGRLDATNVVTPKVCVITPIGLDHTEVLGNTIAEIAAEKAGIIKAGSIVVSSPQADDAATVIGEACARMGATLIRVGSDITWERKAAASGQALTVTGRGEVYETAIPLLGRHQLLNAATAIGALEVLGTRKSAIEGGLRRTHWPGRLQVLRRRPLLVVDGAHTPDSARALTDALREYFHFDNLVLIIGASADKDTGGVVAELAPLASRVVATRSRHPRAAHPEEVAGEFEKRGVAVEVVGGVAAAVARARERATARDLICATGSLFLVAEVIEHVMGLRPELCTDAGSRGTGSAAQEDPMRRARAPMDQPGVTVTVVDRQIDDLLSSIDEKEPAEPAAKPRPKRSRKGDKRRRRVVVTGMGAVTPLGLTVDEYWQGLIDGRSGLGEVTLCDATGLDCKIDGEVKGFDPRNYMDHKEARRMARFSQLLVAASKAAIEDSGLKLDREDPYRLGVFVGNGLGGFPEAEDGCRTLVARGSSKVSPLFMPLILPNMAAGQVSMIFGLKGFTSTTTTACAAATQAIGEAAEVIRRNQADVILAGGTEAGITPTGIAGFCAMKALSTRNDEPTKASRPFDAQRDGFVPAEGAATLILESLEHAQRRGARIYAEVAGFGISSDAYHVTAPDSDGNGAARAMAWAMADANLKPTDVDYINAHGTSTPLNDAIETLAIKRLFGDHAYRLAISATKSMIGHLLGGSGAAEAVACIKSINEGIIHPTINYDYPDPDCDLDYVPNVARKRDVRAALSNSFGFGGQNACLLLIRFEQ